MYNIPLNNSYANQEFDIVFPDTYNLENLHILLQTTDDDSLFLSVFKNNVQLGQTFACCPNQPIIPYLDIVKKIGGNFEFETSENEYPSYQNFGKTCFLKFNTIEELENAQ